MEEENSKDEMRVGTPVRDLASRGQSGAKRSEGTHWVLGVDEGVGYSYSFTDGSELRGGVKVPEGRGDGGGAPQQQQVSGGGGRGRCYQASEVRRQ